MPKYLDMKLACKDINTSTTCTFETEGATATEVATKMLAHARVDHAADIAGMPDDEVIKVFETKVRT